MENAAEALKMAGALLIFVLAISIIIFSFGQVRESADTIIDYRDRETVYIDGGYYYEATGTERQVGLETIIPSIFRAYTENYKIVFDGLSSPLYKIKNINGEEVNKYTIDLESNEKNTYPNVVLANEEQKAEFISAILYGDYTSQKDIEEKFHISLKDCKPLYDQLKNEKIKEYLGVYYQKDDPNVPDVNKTEKRIITYKIGS